MIFQPTTCSICLSKIRIFDLRIGSRRTGPGRTLLCRHVFHASCIDSIYKPQCPLCAHPIFNSDEEALLTCTSDEAAVDILKSIHERDINVKSVFTFLTSGGGASAKYQWIVDLMYKYCDFTELLADNLDDKTLVKEIVARGKVNWFKTFCGGLTFFDLVYERTDDPEIIALVHAKLPMDPGVIRPIPRNSRNSVTSFLMDSLDVSQSPSQSPQQESPQQESSPAPAPHQRHRRADSMSGAALEQCLRGASGPLKRTATVRRSMSRSLYPSLTSLTSLTHTEESVEQPKTYPIYERLYPAVPSAPPIELM